MQDEEVLATLRQKFREAMEKYGERFFNLQDLEERILFMKKNKIPLDVFVRQEIEFYRKLKAKAEEILEDKRRKEEINRRVEEIMAANEERIRSYPDNFFDPRISFEMRYLTGATTRLFPRLQKVILAYGRGHSRYYDFERYLHDLEWFYLPEGRKPAGHLRHYVEILTTQNYRLIEKTERQLMQTVAVALYQLRDFLQLLEKSLPSAIKGQEFDLPPKMPLAQALLELSLECQKILDDFRLEDLARYGSKSS
ncbi:MAG: hypothetical protein NZM25_01635 [Leptospiraceae bacterium]|nr:hypothetical protein [Leptospiraceae bacterium]MDW8307647.1 hypothetical protein [Leptospiraceae bacterium]